MLMMGSTFVKHVPCPQCTSSDGGAVYTDGHIYCYVCGYYKTGHNRSSPSSLLGTYSEEAENGSEPQGRPKVSPSSKGFTPIVGEPRALTKRKISEATCRKYSYTVGNGCQLANYHDPQTGQLIAQHIRTNPKGFKWKGKATEVGLFGRRLWAPGGKRIIITEGEIDAMTVSEALHNTWPVVSVPNGAQGAKKTILKELDYLESFEEVVFCFDSDEPGRKAARECAAALTPGKAKIASLPLKDPNDMWVQGRIKEMLQAILYQAQPYRPDGIIPGTDPKVHDFVVNFIPHADASYPWPMFSKKIYGMRQGELVTHTAGTGIGKSTFCKEIAYHLGVTLGHKVGIVALEESVGRYALALMSIAANRRLHLSDDGVSKEDKEKYYLTSAGNGNFQFYDHFGSLASSNLLSQIRFLIKGYNCKWIILDHLSIVVSGMDESDNERKTLDKLMTDLRSICEETGAGMHVISHLSRRRDGKSHEEGARISLRDLRGSHAIVQLSDIVLGYERDQQDEAHSNRTLVRRLKDRYTGETGCSGVLLYDSETGRVLESNENAEDIDDDEGEGYGF
jgi:twinkle protein